MEKEARKHTNGPGLLSCNCKAIPAAGDFRKNLIGLLQLLEWVITEKVLPGSHEPLNEDENIPKTIFG